MKKVGVLKSMNHYRYHVNHDAHLKDTGYLFSLFSLENVSNFNKS